MSGVGSMHSERNIKELELVQKYALKVSSHCWNMDYEMIFQLPMASLSTMRIYLRITTVHKIDFTFPSDILIPRAANHSTCATTVTTNSFMHCSFCSYFVPRTLYVE